MIILSKVPKSINKINLFECWKLESVLMDKMIMIEDNKNPRQIA